MKRPLCAFGFAYILCSIFMPLYFNTNTVLAAAVVFFTAGVVFAFIRTEKLTPYAQTASLIFIAIALAMANSAYRLESDVRTLAKLGGKKVAIEATVTDITYNVGSTNLICKANLLNVSGAPTTIYIEARNYRADALNVGDSFVGDFTFSLPMSYEHLASNINDGLHGYLNSSTIIEDDVFILTASAAKLRSYMASNINKRIPSPYSGLAIGISTGDRSYMSDTLTQDMSLVGAAHITAVSGMHMSIITYTAVALLVMLGINIRMASACAIPIALLFGFLCGFTPSVSRSVIMIIISLLAQAIFRKSDMLTSLAFAGTFTLIINPLYAHELGFIMSYACCLGMALLSPVIKTSFPLSDSSKILRFMYESFVQSLSAFIALFAISPIYFGYLFVLSPFVNVICSVFLQPLLIFSLLSAVIPSVVGIGIIASISSIFATLCAMPIVFICTFFAHAKLLMLPINTPTDIVAIILCLLLIILAFSLFRYRICLAILPLCCMFILFSAKLSIYFHSANGISVLSGEGFFTIEHDSSTMLVYEEYDSYTSHLATRTLSSPLRVVSVSDNSAFTGDTLATLFEANMPHTLVHNSGYPAESYLNSFHEINAVESHAPSIKMSNEYEICILDCGCAQISKNSIFILKKTQNCDIIKHDAINYEKYGMIIDENGNVIKNELRSFSLPFESEGVRHYILF